MQQKNNPTKRVIIRYKIKKNEHINTESQKDLKKNSLNELRNANGLQRSLNNLEKFNITESQIDDSRKTLKPKKINHNHVNNTSLRKTFFLNNKEKISSLKMQTQKKEKDNKDHKGKKVVNFSGRRNIIKTQKSEKNLMNSEKDENQKELKLNKSVGNLKKNIFNKKNFNSESLNQSSYSENEDINKSESKNINSYNKQSIKNNSKNEENLKIVEFNEEPLNRIKINVPEEENQLEIVEIKTNFLQLEKEKLKNKEINNSETININKLNEENQISEVNKKFKFEENNENVDLDKKEQNNKENKAYTKFVQNIRKSNAKKKNNNIATNLLKYEEPKKKFANIVKKVNFINKSLKSLNKEENKNKNLRATINNPLISKLREDILYIKEEKNNEQQNNSCKNILKDINNNQYNIDKNSSGIILIKLEKGEKKSEINLEGEIEDINEIFIREKIEINKKQVILIDINELEKIKKENEKIKEELLKLKEESKKQKEKLLNYENEKKIKEKPLLTSIKKKTKEEENNQIEEDNIKIKEIKDRIQKYKEELKSGGTNENARNEMLMMSCRVKFNNKESFKLENKNQEILKSKDKLKKEAENINLKNNENKNINSNEIQKNIEIKPEINTNKNEIKITINQNENLPNKINNEKIENNNENLNKDKKENNNENLNKVNKDKKENKDNKENNKNKAYSKALDRFKRKYKKDNSMEIRTKRSDKISEIAKQLENVMGRQSSLDLDNNNNEEIVHNQISSDIISNKIVNSNKVKKPARPQI